MLSGGDGLLLIIETYLIEKLGGSEWESNPPATGDLPPDGFEDNQECSDRL